jgi:hypothetical protein
MRYIALAVALSFALSPLQAKNRSDNSGKVHIVKAKRNKVKNHRPKRKVKARSSRVN